MRRCLFEISAIACLLLMGTAGVRADSSFSQGPQSVASFLVGEPAGSGSGGYMSVLAYSWRGYVTVWYVPYGSGALITKVDMSVYMSGVYQFGPPPITIYQAISVDVYSGGTKVGTLYPNYSENFLHSPTDFVYGGAAYPNVYVDNPSFMVNCAAYSPEAIWGSAPMSWGFRLPLSGQEILVPLLRYYNPSNNDHFYTTNYAELGGGSGGYVREQNEGMVYTIPVPGTVRVYRYYNSSTGQHFYTINFGEIGNGEFGYHLEDQTFYVFPSGSSSVDGTYTVPMRRYYSPHINGHFYSLYYGNLGADWEYERIAWWEIP